MAGSTGPILAVGAITLFNDTVVHTKTVGQDTRVIVGTAIAAGGLYLLEKVDRPLAVGLAWVAFVAVMFTRMDPKVPSPVESFLSWYNAK